MKKIILRNILCVVVFILMALGSKAQQVNHVLVEVLGAAGCYFCPGALDAAKNIDGNTAIVYWYEDKVQQDFVHMRRDYYNIDAYPTSWFNGRERVIGGGTGTWSVQPKFDEKYEKVKNDTAHYFIEIQNNNSVVVLYSGEGGTLWFVAKDDLDSHKPYFITTIEIEPGLNHFEYFPEEKDREYISWVEDSTGILNVAKYTVLTTGVDSPTEEEKEIIISNGYIYPNSDYMIVCDTYGRKIKEIFENTPISLQSLKSGMLMCRTKNGYFKIWNK